MTGCLVKRRFFQLGFLGYLGIGRMFLIDHNPRLADVARAVVPKKLHVQFLFP